MSSGADWCSLAFRVPRIGKITQQGRVAQATGKGRESAWCPQKSPLALLPSPGKANVLDAGLWGSRLAWRPGHRAHRNSVLAAGAVFHGGFGALPTAGQLAQHCFRREPSPAGVPASVLWARSLLPWCERDTRLGLDGWLTV